MAGRKFKTVPDELLHVADAAADHMNDNGYTVRAERQELGYPYCPAIFCKRGNSTCIVEVAATVNKSRVQEWVAYGRSCGRDFRVAIAVSFAVDASTRDELSTLGVGLMECESGAIRERVAAIDLSVNVQLPPMSAMPAAVRKLVGEAYEHFRRGNWMEGFQSATQSLESEARKYLKRHLARLVFVGKPVTKTKIDRMTLGALAKQFANIQNKNQDDSRIGDTLAAINSDRIGVVHHRARKRAEDRLRRNVGQHMWAICQAMRHVVK